jgi:uncharacterized protein
MFAMADDTWRAKPTRISEDVVAVVARRIAEHISAHDLDEVEVVLHGGEPLLVGADHLDAIVNRFRAATPARVNLRVQTNGTLISDSMLDVLIRNNIRVGVSIDGSAEANDRHRRYRNGRGSHAVVEASLERLRARAPELFSGLLSTVDLRNDPVDTYQSLMRFAPPQIDLLLPHGNWSAPPPSRDPMSTDAPYGEWLAKVFDHWYGESTTCDIRMFTEIIHLLFGGRSSVETVGLSPVGVLVIDTDGTVEQVDALRSAYAGAAATGLNLHTHALDAALEHPAIIARQIGRDGLGPVCRACELHRVCGGGLYAHRYRAGTGFLNESVYCHDLAHLIRHIHRRVSSDVAELTARVR